MKKESFGIWIKTRRRACGLGLLSCSCRVGISGMSLFDIERGKTDPSLAKAATLYGLSVALVLDPAEVLERAARSDAWRSNWWDRKEEQGQRKVKLADKS